MTFWIFPPGSRHFSISGKAISFESSRIGRTWTWAAGCFIPSRIFLRYDLIIMKLLYMVIILYTIVYCSTAVLDYPLKCSWWTWGDWDKRDCLPLGHPSCAKEKRKEFRHRSVQWRPKYGQKFCSGKYVDFRPCICLSPEAIEFVTPPKYGSGLLTDIGEFIETIFSKLANLTSDFL